MEEGNFRVSGSAGQALTSNNVDSYDKNYRLEDGKKYNIVLVPGRDVIKNRTTASLQEYARSFGYEVPLAGVVPRIRETVSDKQMKQMEIWYIAALHTPINDVDGGRSFVFNASRFDIGQWLDTNWEAPDNQ